MTCECRHSRLDMHRDGAPQSWRMATRSTTEALTSRPPESRCSRPMCAPMLAHPLCGNLQQSPCAFFTISLTAFPSRTADRVHKHAATSLIPRTRVVNPHDLPSSLILDSTTSADDVSLLPLVVMRVMTANMILELPRKDLRSWSKISWSHPRDERSYQAHGSLGCL